MSKQIEMSVLKKTLLVVVLLSLGLLCVKQYCETYIKDYFTGEKSSDNYDTWKDVGDKSLRYKIYSAYFDDRVESLGKGLNLYLISIFINFQFQGILQNLKISQY